MTFGKSKYPILVGSFGILLTCTCRQSHRIPIRIDHRTRRDRAERRDKAFDAQMEALVDAYMAWSFANTNKEGTGFYSGMENQHIPIDAGITTVKVVDVYSEYNLYCHFFSERLCYSRAVVTSFDSTHR
jgi:hypothetical protein